MMKIAEYSMYWFKNPAKRGPIALPSAYPNKKKIVIFWRLFLYIWPIKAEKAVYSREEPQPWQTRAIIEKVAKITGELEKPANPKIVKPKDNKSDPHTAVCYLP